MDNNTLQIFISDVVSEITQKRDEAQQEMKNNSGDSFASGRALALEEVFELIQTRMKVYDVKPNR